MALDIRKFLGRFVEEARDHIARLETGLNALANGAADGEAINALFRSAHTIKGSSRMLKLVSITETAHQLEEVLGALREGRIAHTPELGSLLIRAVDAIHALVEQTETGDGPLPPPDPALGDALIRAAAGEAFGPPGPQPLSVASIAAVPAGVTPPLSILPPEESQNGAAKPVAQANAVSSLAGESRSGGSAAETVRVRLEKLDDLLKLMGEVVSNQVKLRQRALEVRALDRAVQSLLAVGGACPELAEPAQVLHRLAETLRDDVQEQERLTGRLSDQTLIMRMLPLSRVFDPAARMARELARSLGKEVRCEVSGGEIELDRQIIDRLNDVLTHLLRNAIDHGIEPPEERQAAGKSPISRLSLAARQEGAGVVIEASDDGRGLHRDKILATAMHRGLIDPGHGATLTDEQVAELIFQPGLSTSARVTDLSGRGVGMDVVKRIIVDELRGAISVASHPGQGTAFGFKLPLSLAMMRVLLFQCAQRVFGLAAHHIVELVRVPAEAIFEVVGRPTLALHNEFVPLMPLAELLGLPGAQNARDEPLLVVVIGIHPAKLGLAIDRLIDERDMVIKPLPEHLRNAGLVGGIVVTGANELVSVLQAPALLDLARRARNQTILRNASDRESSPGPQAHHILVVDDSLNTREIEREVLEACGYRVTLAEDGLDGWRKAVNGRFDAVLTDVEMPGLDGFSLTARLRENENYQATPIIIVTSREKEEDRRRGVQVGADAYIVKGDFDQSSLVGTLRNLLG